MSDSKVITCLKCLSTTKTRKESSMRIKFCWNCGGRMNEIKDRREPPPFMMDEYGSIQGDLDALKRSADRLLHEQKKPSVVYKWNEWLNELPRR